MGSRVLSELAALLPEGTSYLAEAVAKPDGKSLASVTVTVIEGRSVPARSQRMCQARRQRPVMRWCCRARP